MNRLKIRRTFLFYFLFSSGISSLCAQLSYTSSLEKRLETAADDSLKVFLLNELIEAEGTEDWEKYNNQLHQIAEKNISGAAPRKEYFQKYLAIAICNEGVIASDKGDTKTAFACYDKALKLSTLLNDSNGMAAVLNNIGFIHDHQGNTYKAIEYYEAALKLYLALEDTTPLLGAAGIFNNLGDIYKDRGDIPRAISCHQQALKIRESCGEQSDVAQSLNNLGVIYDQQGDFPGALSSYSRALKILEKTGNKKGMSYCLNNMATLFRDHDTIINGKKNTDLAFDYYTNSLRLREELNDKTGTSYSLNNLGSFLMKEGKNKEAENYFQHALSLREEMKDKKGIAGTLEHLATLKFNMRETAAAKQYATRSLIIAREIGFPENIANSALILKKIYTAEGDYTKALNMFELYISMRDSVNNENTKKASIKSVLKYEYEKRAAADSVKNSEEQKVKDAQLSAQSASLEQEKTQRYALYGGLFLIAVFLAFVYNRFRLTQKQKKVIEDQKILVDHAYGKLHEKNKEVMDSIHYARRIQKALITNEKYIQKNLFRLNKQ